MSDPVIVAIIGNIPTFLMALAAFISSLRNRKAIGKVDEAVNGRVTQLLEQTARASRAEGVASRETLS